VTAARVARRDRPLRPLSRSPIRCRSRQPRRRSGPSTVAASASWPARRLVAVVAAMTS